MVADLLLKTRSSMFSFTADYRLPYPLAQLPYRLGLKSLHDPQATESELKEYLGTSFEPWRLANSVKLLEEELVTAGDEETLYRTSRGYLYDLTAFAMTTTKDPYLALLETAVRPPARVLDYGCGIGSDGLYLLDRGYDVAFADFDNPSTRYLRWRLSRRRRSGAIYDLDEHDLPGDFDLAFAFDVIEHVPDPFAFLDRLEQHAARVMVNLLEPQVGETTLHHELPVVDLLNHVSNRGLLSYSLHYGVSHLVMYEPGTRSRGAARRRAQRAAARLAKR